MKPYYQDDAVTIYHGDCRDILPTLEPVDLVLTDPPYAAAAATATTGWAKQKWGGNWGDMSLLVMLTEFVLDSGVVLPLGQVLWFCDHLGYAALIPSFFRRFTTVQSIVWDRDMLGMGAHFRKQTEFIIYGRQHDSPLLTKSNARDIIRLRPSYSNREHPASKPLSLLTYLLDCVQSNLTLDPFMGSGTTLLAAKNLGRKAIGIEIEERYCEIAAKRMSQTVMQL